MGQDRVTTQRTSVDPAPVHSSGLVTLLSNILCSQALWGESKDRTRMIQDQGRKNPTGSLGKTPDSGNVAGGGKGQIHEHLHSSGVRI